MGCSCEPCETNNETADVPMRKQTEGRNRFASFDSTDGYDPDTSDVAEDSKSVSSQMDNLELTEHEINSAHDGWKNAIEAGNESYVTYMIEEYPQLDFFKYYWNDGSSALQIACKHQKARLVFLLLTQKAKVNEQNPETLDTALHIAVRVRDEKIVDLLLKWDADPNIENKKHETAISISATYRDKDIYHRIVGNDDDENMNENEPQMNRLQTNAEKMVGLHDDITSLFVVQSDNHTIDDCAEEVLAPSHHQSMDETMRSENEQKLKQIKKKRADTDLILASHAAYKRNPFRNPGLVRKNTAAVKKIAEEKMSENGKKPLPKLEAWLEKKKPHGVGYQKRWVIVKGAYMLWSSKQRHISDDGSKEERKKFNGSIHLMTIQNVSPQITTNNTKFIIKAKDAKHGNMREYVLRCQNKNERDFWVAGLKQHKQQYEIVMSYLGK